MSHVYVIGAGLAGLSAAVHAANCGHKITVFESAARAGGRCRSFFDDTLGLEIDNGNHFVMGCNDSLWQYLDICGDRSGFEGLSPPSHPFLDIRTGERWRVSPGGPIPLWIFNPERRTKGTTALDHLSALKMGTSGPNATVAAALKSVSEAAMTGLYEPACEAILNTQVEDGAASLLWAVFAASFLKGADASRLFVARKSLDDAVVTPAVSFLERNGADLRLNTAVKALNAEDGRVTAIHLRGEEIAISTEDQLIIAIPAWGRVLGLDPLQPPDLGTRAILNAHFAVPEDKAKALDGPLLGLIGSTAQWLVKRPGLVSVTVSAADRFMNDTSEDLAAMLWSDVAKALEHPEMPQPPCRIIKEKRATIAHIPQNLPLRPPANTDFTNVARAGDWTQTGLPCTIEGAIQSGRTACEHLGLI